MGILNQWKALQEASRFMGSGGCLMKSSDATSHNKEEESVYRATTLQGYIKGQATQGSEHSSRRPLLSLNYNLLSASLCLAAILALETAARGLPGVPTMFLSTLPLPSALPT